MCSTFETYASVRVLQWPSGRAGARDDDEVAGRRPEGRENLRPLIGGHATPVLPYVLA